jgi:hypothetical protein
VPPYLPPGVHQWSQRAHWRTRPATTTTVFEHRVQSIEARHLRDRHHKVGARELHKPLNLSLVVALGWSPEPVTEQVVTDEFGEGTGPIAFAVAADFGHRDFELS